VLPQNAKSVFDRLPGQKQMIWADGGQTDFYDRKPLVEKAVAGAHEHFGRILVSRAKAASVYWTLAQIARCPMAPRWTKDIVNTKSAASMILVILLVGTSV
jgi:hypothetical protein